MTESYYGIIEKGVRTPSLNVALAIAKLFNVDPAIFLLNRTTFCCSNRGGDTLEKQYTGNSVYVIVRYITITLKKKISLS
ncbi:helix-turn-helix domain-containing protein [Rummeliibacillus suwonensis]|uniref:helix-turn-helix domain-containing protein n=1 Tax=Rummeliibacillus suwonensis TaxID=1306154 RepID=UPI001AAE228E|nr:helix-turn-helix transcriptional regulator [Rummeliibacillus suwonensis]